MRFLFPILFLCCGSLFSQNVFTLKPGLGINGTQVHGDGYSGYDKAGLFLGVAVNARLNERTSLELGFYFSQKGSRHTPNPKTGDFSYYRLNLNYIELPLSLRYHLNPKYFLTLGPYISYLINFRENINYSDVTHMNSFNSFEMGANVGLGRQIAKNFYLEVRCGNSLFPVWNYGFAATLVPYPNPVARFFNKGLYNNVLTLFVAWKPDFSSRKKTDD